MDNPQAAVVFQEPDKDHPAKITINPLDYEFASVFNQIFPEVKCPHCYAQMRLLFYAGVLSADKTYEALDKIRSEEHLDSATKWYHSQVQDAQQELDVELKVITATREWCMHNEPPGYN